MSFDALTLSAVRDELEPLLTDSRVQRVAFADELSLAIEVFASRAGRTNVLLSAHAEQGRVQRIARLPARGLERDTPFSLVVRKYLRNAHIRSIRQPRLERLFELDCEQRDDSGKHSRVLLIVEAMGRRGNLVLVGEDGAILDAARRSPPSRNPRRPVLPHLPYVEPPLQERLLPEQVSADALETAARSRTGSLARLLSETLAGLSPLAGRELAFRATGAADAGLSDVDWQHVADQARAFLSLVDNHSWQPSLALEGDHPIDYAPYVLTHLAAAGAAIETFDSMSEAIDVYFERISRVGPGPARRGDVLAAERRALLVPLEKLSQSQARRIAALEHQLESGHERRDPLRRAGDLILTHQVDLPPGSTELVAEGERFELDPHLNAADNAQVYFARYRKAREAEERVPALLAEAKQKAAHVADLRTLVELADGMDTVRALRREVAAATGDKEPARKSKQPSKTSAPYRRVSLGDGWEALVGTSAAGNATVTFDLASPDDVWLHARAVPGAHVILRTRSATPPDEVLQRAAELAAFHSSARASVNVEVDVALRRYVKKIPGAPPGLVRYTNERTIRVSPAGK